jgi:hypothetical protein
MTDTAQENTQPKKARRPRARKSKPLSGEVTVIDVPKPPASAFNKNRPVGCLLQAQLQHIHHAESARLPILKRDGRRPEDIHTEAEAASYIASVTKVLHPLRRRKPRSRPATP